jgi:hypothetical protein
MEDYDMVAKNRKSGSPEDSAGTLEVQTPGTNSGLMNPNMETAEAILHITRELKGMIHLLGKDKLKELIDILDAGEPRLSRGVEFARIETEKLSGGVGTVGVGIV